MAFQIGRTLAVASQGGEDNGYNGRLESPVSCRLWESQQQNTRNVRGGAAPPLRTLVNKGAVALGNEKGSKAWPLLLCVYLQCLLVSYHVRFIIVLSFQRIFRCGLLRLL